MPISLINVLLDQVVLGNARVAQLIDQAKPNEPIRYNNQWALYRKVKPGQFEVVTGTGDTQEQVLPANNPVEAKLMVLEHMVEVARQAAQVSTEEQPTRPAVVRPHRR